MISNILAFAESLPEEKILLTNVTSTSVSLLCRISQTNVRKIDESADRGYVVIIYSNVYDVFTDVVFDAWPLRYQFKSLKPHTYYHIRVVSNEMGTYYETKVTTSRFHTCQTALADRLHYMYRPFL